MLVIDVSGSMQAEDVEPTRLEAAQKVVRGFLDGLPKRFKVGVVAFSETAEVAAPATDDRQLAIDAIDYLYPQRGTAIGDGIARGVEVARAADAGERGAASGRPRSCCSRTARRPRAILLPAGGSGAREVVQDPRLHDRARHAGGDRRVQPLRRHADHPRPARPGDTAADRGTSTGGRFYEAESVGDLRDAYEQDGLAREQGRAEAGGDVRIPRGRPRAAARRRPRSRVVTFPRLP